MMLTSYMTEPWESHFATLNLNFLIMKRKERERELMLHAWQHCENK